KKKLVTHPPCVCRKMRAVEQDHARITNRGNTTRGQYKRRFVDMSNRHLPCLHRYADIAIFPISLDNELGPKDARLYRTGLYDKWHRTHRGNIKMRFTDEGDSARRRTKFCCDA